MAKHKKTKPQPISPARQAVFAKYGIAPAEAANLHEQVELNFELLKDCYAGKPEINAIVGHKPPAWTGDHEADGNLILERFLNTKVETAQRVMRQVHAREKHTEAFLKTFGVPLRDFWANNLLGFDICQFDREVVKSGDRMMSGVIRERWGEDAIKIIDELMGDEPQVEAA